MHRSVPLVKRTRKYYDNFVITLIYLSVSLLSCLTGKINRHNNIFIRISIQQHSQSQRWHRRATAKKYYCPAVVGLPRQSKRRRQIFLVLFIHNMWTYHRKNNIFPEKNSSCLFAAFVSLMQFLTCTLHATMQYV